MFWLIALLTSIPLLILFLFLWFYLWAKKKHTYWLQRGIYSPPSHWLYGHLFNFEAGTYPIAQHFANICKSGHNQQVPAIGVYIFCKPCLLLCDSNLICRLLLKDSHFFASCRCHIQGQSDMIDNINPYGLKIKSPWIGIALEKQVNHERLHTLFPLMLEGAEHLRYYLDKKVPSSEEVQLHVHDASRRFITDVMMSVVFGVSTNSFAEPDTEIYKRACGLYKTSQPSLLLVFIRILFPRLRAQFGICTTRTDLFRDLFWKSMNERKKTSKWRGDFMDLLLELHSFSNNGFKFCRDELFAQAMLLVVAGLETSAMTITLTLFEMAQNPKIQKRLRQEIHEKIGTKPITFKLICKMSYLKSVVLETLRMNPSTPFLRQVAKQNYKIPSSNIVIEKGTVVYVSLRGLHLNPLSFPSPLIYNPDRFSKQNRWRIKKGTYLPFGNERIKCIENRLVLAQIMLGLIVVMRDYEISMNLNVHDRAEITSALLNGDFLMTLKKSPIIDD